MLRTATLLVKCPDQKGVVASLAQLLYGFGCNIVSSDQYSDVQDNMFYQVGGRSTSGNSGSKKEEPSLAGYLSCHHPAPTKTSSALGRTALRNLACVRRLPLPHPYSLQPGL